MKISGTHVKSEIIHWADKAEKKGHFNSGNIKNMKVALIRFDSVTDEHNLKIATSGFIDWAKKAKQDKYITDGNLQQIIKKTNAVVGRMTNSPHTGHSHKSKSTSKQIKHLATLKTYLHFYLKGTLGFLGNFHTSPLTYNGKSYQNVEAAFQAQKFKGNESDFKKLSGDVAFQLSRKLSNTQQLPTSWHQDKVQIMKDLLTEKFKDKKLGKYLLATGDTFLIEHNEKKGRDTFWSDDHDGTGQNILGLLLMDVRKALGGTGRTIIPREYFDDLKKQNNNLGVL